MGGKDHKEKVKSPAERDQQLREVILLNTKDKDHQQKVILLTIKDKDHQQKVIPLTIKDKDHQQKVIPLNIKDKDHQGKEKVKNSMEKDQLENPETAKDHQPVNKVNLVEKDQPEIPLKDHQQPKLPHSDVLITKLIVTAFQVKSVKF